MMLSITLDLSFTDGLGTVVKSSGVMAPDGL